MKALDGRDPMRQNLFGDDGKGSYYEMDRKKLSMYSRDQTFLAIMDLSLYLIGNCGTDGAQYQSRFR